MTKSAYSRTALATAVHDHGGSFQPLFRVLMLKKTAFMFSGRLSLSSMASFSNNFQYHARKRKESLGASKTVTPQEKRTRKAANKHHSLPMSTHPSYELLNDSDNISHTEVIEPNGVTVNGMEVLRAD